MTKKRRNKPRKLPRKSPGKNKGKKTSKRMWKTENEKTKKIKQTYKKEDEW